MRLEVIIPDPLFESAKRAATASGISVDAYVQEAVQLHLQEDPSDDMSWYFTPAVLAEIDAAAEEARSGNNITLDQYREEAKKRSAEWRANHPG